MNDVAELRRHLAAEHPGADAPWWTGSSFLEETMSPAAVDRLHAELHRQGEDHGVERTPVIEFIEVRPAICRRTRCGDAAVSELGLCARHDGEYGQRRSA